MSFPPFILPRFTVNKHALATAVQSVIEPCNIAVYLHSKKLYFHSISRASCNKYRLLHSRSVWLYSISISMTDFVKIRQTSENIQPYCTTICVINYLLYDK